MTKHLQAAEQKYSPHSIKKLHVKYKTKRDLHTVFQRAKYLYSSLVLL